MRACSVARHQWSAREAERAACRWPRPAATSRTPTPRGYRRGCGRCPGHLGRRSSLIATAIEPRGLRGDHVPDDLAALRSCNRVRRRLVGATPRQSCPSRRPYNTICVSGALTRVRPAPRGDRRSQDLVELSSALVPDADHVSASPSPWLCQPTPRRAASRHMPHRAPREEIPRPMVMPGPDRRCAPRTPCRCRRRRVRDRRACVASTTRAQASVRMPIAVPSVQGTTSIA